jgi:outer membrane protein assembly factor BamB
MNHFRSALIGFGLISLMAALTGCSGGGGTSSSIAPSKSGKGRATLTITWPVRTRLIPVACNSINVEILQGSVVFTQQLVARPVTGNSTTVSFPVLPTGTLTVSATAYPTAGTTGVAQATGSEPLVIQANQNTTFSLTMDSTITHVAIGPAPLFWNGRTMPLSASAFDANNNMVLTTPTKWNWSSASTGVATITSGNNPANVTGVSPGTSLITATESESNISGTSTITVIQPGLAPLPWSKFQANVANTGLGSGTGATGVQQWSFATTNVIYSSMAIANDGTIYVGSSDNNLYAVSPTGTVVWTYTTGGQVSCPLVGADNTIYVASGDGKVYNLNPDGTLRWSTASPSAIYTNPTIGPDGTIYTASIHGTLNAMDGLTGVSKWTFTAPSSLFFDSPAVATDGTIYVGSDNASAGINTPTNLLFAVNPNGQQKWTWGDGWGIDASPSVGPDGTIFVCTFMSSIYGITPAGTVSWQSPLALSSRGPFTAAAVSSTGRLYVGDTQGNMYAFTTNGQFQWSFTLGGPFVSAPAIGGDGTIYVGYSNSAIGTAGQFYAVSPTGTQNWVLTSGPITGSSAVAGNGVIYTAAGTNMLAIH